MCSLAALAITASGGPAEAFSSFPGIDKHSAIMDAALSCDGQASALVDPACFEPRALARLKAAVLAPDSKNSRVGEEDISAAHCDNGDFLPAESSTEPETFDRIVDSINSGHDRRVKNELMRELNRDIRIQYPIVQRQTGARLRGDYPHDQAAATANIQACIDRYRTRARAAATAALAAVSGGGSTGGGPCASTVAQDPIRPNLGSNSQTCLALAQFGRGLHIVQDFYAHSNWVDPIATPGQPLLLAPPGLNNTLTTTRLFDLTGAAQPIPAGLITGCYPEKPRENCDRRVMHGNPFDPESRALSKDDARYDAARERYGRLPRYDVAFNLAVIATQEQWVQLKAAIRAEATTPERAALAICVLTHDNPRVCVALAVTTASLPDATVGQPYSTTLAATRGLPPYAWTAAGLPAGLSVDRSSGVISGTPTADTSATGPAGVLITVTDDAGATASVTLPLTVKPAATPPPPPAPGSLEVLTTGAGYGAVPGPDGRVWLVARAAGQLTSTRIQAVDPATLAIQTYTPTPAPAGFSAAPTFDGQGNLWIADTGGKLARFTPATGAFTEFPLPAECGSVDTAGLHTATDGTVWVNCGGQFSSRTVLARVTPAGAMTIVQPLSTAPLLGPLTPGVGGSMWAVGYSAGFSAGLVRVSAGGQPTLFPNTNGVAGYGVAGNGSRVIELGTCAGTVATTCLASVGDDGGRTALNTRTDAPPDMLRIVPPAIAANGDVWALVNGSAVGPYYYQFGTAGTVHPFSLPPGSHVSTLIPGLHVPPVITGDGALWVEETSTGILLRVTV